jgi:hypothetical protein
MEDGVESGFPVTADGKLSRGQLVVFAEEDEKPQLAVNTCQFAAESALVFDEAWDCKCDTMGVCAIPKDARCGTNGILIGAIAYNHEPMCVQRGIKTCLIDIPFLRKKPSQVGVLGQEKVMEGGSR